jgi:uncharacterized protein YndB with AHSA1/START domain
MKKTESKLKTSKSSPVVKGSAASSKTAKPGSAPKKEIEAKKETKPIAAKSNTGKPVIAKNTTPDSKKVSPAKTKLKPELLKATVPPVKDRLAMSAPAKVAKATKPPKDPKVKQEKKPQKLVQVVPTHRPTNIPIMPVNKEKMLMRFGKPAKRVLFKVDFLLKASPTIVYHFITTPSCLVRWFCDAVDITGEFYTFSWKGNTEVAELIDDYEDERLRFRWLDGEDEEEFFEFRISTADITDETILEIYDFAWADEVEEQKQLWRTQVDRLRKETGDQ